MAKGIRNSIESFVLRSIGGARPAWLVLLAVCCVAAAGQSRSVCAALLATAEITAQQIDANTYQYDVTLNDTGTTNIATFWYAWVPGKGFLASQPTNIQGPAGWTDIVTETYAIQWVNSSSPLTAGNSLTGFQFDSPDTPSQVFGLSQAFPTTLVGTSFVYAGAPLSTPSLQFVVQSPEPSTFALCVLGAIGVLLAARGRRGGG
jgi:hypothetical protein